MTSLHPLQSLFVFLRCLLARRVHFPRRRIGNRLTIDNVEWVIFRELVLDPAPGQLRQPGAVFRPRFHLNAMPGRVNMLFSWLPIPFFAGLPGFRDKLWLYDPVSGDFAGLYHWDSAEDASAYRDSFAGQFMTRRSLPGTFSVQIEPVKNPETKDASGME